MNTDGLHPADAKLPTHIAHSLNGPQREAVAATEGRVRVVAGAGSGKTRVLTHRFAYLVNVLGIDPANILCMTFTNKAAQEMKMRIGALAGREHANDFVCTIHGFCVRLLRQEISRLGYPKGFTILDTSDAQRLAKQILTELGISRQEMTVKKFLDRLGAYKDSSRGGYVAMLEAGHPETPERTFTAFLQQQLKLFALDFDDLIYFALHVLKRFPEAREFWQRELNYVQVDETQDCSEREWELVELLCARHGNLFVVGDPDQAIYEWRGARPELFVQFHSDRDVILNENYRSTPQVLEVANAIIAHNTNRIPKDLFTRQPAGIQAVHLHAKSEEEEYEWIASRIAQHVREGGHCGEFAILYRASRLLRALEQALQRKRLNYEVWGDMRFFERLEIKDAIAYLSLVARGDDLSFARVVNVPSRKFGDVSMQQLRELAAQENRSLYETLVGHLGNRPFHRESIRQFVALIEEARGIMSECSISDLLEMLLQKSGLKEELRRDTEEERLENLDELMQSIHLYEERHRDSGATLMDYLQDIALYTNADYRHDQPTVKLMTVHQSKGLEFPYVFVCGLTEGIFPSHRSIRQGNKRGEEEERRLMYVAVTRAQRGLYLTESEGYNRSTKTDKYPSRYFNEIGDGLITTIGDVRPELLEGTRRLGMMLDMTGPQIDEGARFAHGARVEHVAFGAGTVVAYRSESDSYVVQFEHGERVIRTDFLRRL